MSTILPAIASSLHNIGLLCVHVPASDCASALQYLTIPAEHLLVLVINVVLDSERSPLPVLPHDLLQGHAPRLLSVALFNLDVSQIPPGVFHSVTQLTLGYLVSEIETKVVVPDLSSNFPSLRTLTTIGGAALEDTWASRDAWAQLEWLVLLTNLPVLLYAFETERACAQISQIPNVQISRPLASAIDIFVQDVPGPIQVALHTSKDAGSCVRVIFGDKAWRRSRSFLALRADWLAQPEPPVCGLLSRPDFVERIVSLTLPDYLWQSATRAMSPLNQLAELRLVLDLDSPVAFTQLGPLGKVVCPSLRRLVLRVEDGEYYVTLSQVRDFTSQALLGWRAPLELHFEGVTLVGFGRYIPDDKTFTYCWKPAKQWV
ncbi:hypothetical protein AURDEDRAFT_124084 [Auricularia subglabra TFB-10046 SS5]|nr:hypothetical protein AURDEDRAFT_124084 [Auricularia subglabra TFB-10046 SS5]